MADRQRTATRKPVRPGGGVMRSRFGPCWAVLVGLLVAAASLAVSSGVTAGPASAAGTVTTTGTWPGVGTICGSGSGGGSTARGVSSKSIDIATFADPGNTVQPGLNVEFFQAAAAFAKWCNAAGGIDGRKIVVHDRDAALFNAAQVTNQACQQDFMSVGGGMALDQPSVPVRVGCGLGQITGFTVSDAGRELVPAGQSRGNEQFDRHRGRLVRRPGQEVPNGDQALRHRCGQNNPSILEPTKKWRDGSGGPGVQARRLPGCPR